ncbi:MAG TPA: hypothetical protein VK536_08650 [Candidatus Limnocylindrales bacterium]|nr:hypothetical protein [Candidatus Limnocylindrales bacterium]
MYLGWLLSVLILVPNLVYFRYSPTSVPAMGAKPKKLMVLLERVGQVGVFAVPLVYQTFLETVTEKLCLLIMTVFLAVYYVCWIRYFHHGRRFGLLYEPLFALPFPLVVCPIIYFMAASVFLGSLPLLIFTLVLAVGHTDISKVEYQRY